MGSTAAFFLGKRLGRRDELQLAAALYGGAALGMATAPSLPVLIASHAAYGLGIGLAMHAAPAYIAETAPVSVRGLLISFKVRACLGRGHRRSRPSQPLLLLFTHLLIGFPSTLPVTLNLDELLAASQLLHPEYPPGCLSDPCCCLLRSVSSLVAF